MPRPEAHARWPAAPGPWWPAPAPAGCPASRSEAPWIAPPVLTMLRRNQPAASLVDSSGHGTDQQPRYLLCSICPMLVLGIETTCDEAAAVVERSPTGEGRILSNIVLSQVSEHAAYGGVVPEIAARAHVEALDHVIARAMAEAGCSFDTIDGVAAAAGPGLIGGVIVGLTTAKAIALVREKPLLAVNHLEAHALTARLTDTIAFPYCLFLASGGHTQIVAVRGVGDYVRLGTTVDDAIGEAFDKTAKLLGLGYPGGPLVEMEAKAGNPARFALPRPMAGRQHADFSMSGLKTALRLEAEKVAPLTQNDVRDFCASFQQSVIEVVTDRL